MFPLVRPVYPERADNLPENRLDEWGELFAGSVSRARRARSALRTDFVARVRAIEKELDGLGVEALRAAARDIGKLLRRDGFLPEPAARAFAIVCATAQRVLGMRHFDVQLLGGWILL